MYKKFIVIISLLLSNYSFAQSFKKGFNDFYIGGGINYTKGLIFNSYFPPDSTVKELTRKEWGYSINVGSEYTLSKKCIFSAGFAYSTIQYSKSIGPYHFGSDLRPDGSIADSYINTILNLKYVDIPLILKYFLDKHKTSYLGVGLGMNVLVKESYKRRIFYGTGGTDDLLSVKAQNPRVGNYSIYLLGGKKYQLNPKLSLKVEPSIQFKLKADNFDTFKTPLHQLTFGLNTYLNINQLNDKKKK